MKRNDLIEKLVRSKPEPPTSSHNYRFYFIDGLIAVLVLFVIYSFFEDRSRLSLHDTLSFVGGIFIFIFFRQFYNFHANVRYAYYLLSLVFYILWFMVLVPDAYRDLVADGFPDGYKCLAEIIIIGIILGIIIKNFILGNTILQSSINTWVSIPVALGTGFCLVNILCIIPDASHDIFWHGLLPILIIFWIFFRKL